jgi:hypothetical protein
MDSNLHMHVASLQIQDEIIRASVERRAAAAKRAGQANVVAPVAPRSRWARLQPAYLIRR